MSKFLNRTGDTALSRNGHTMTIVAYRNANDIDIMFDDGYLVTHRSYGDFVRGNIGRKSYIDTILGKSIKHPSGLIMTVVAARNSRDIDVQFEDGVIVTHQRYYAFCSGGIKHPTINPKAYRTSLSRIGFSGCNKQGLKYSIVCWRTVRDIDVQFEDGAIVAHRQYIDFCRGTISYPFAQLNMQITQRGIAYTFGDTQNFYCQCTKCGHKDIMTIQEMRNHVCQNL